MTTQIEREWAALDGDEKVVMIRDDKEQLLVDLVREGHEPKALEIVAFPKNDPPGFI